MSAANSETADATRTVNATFTTELWMHKWRSQARAPADAALQAELVQVAKLRLHRQGWAGHGDASPPHLVQQYTSTGKLHRY
jgi:hypothetical protein